MRYGIPDVTPTMARDVTAFRVQSSVLDEQALLHHVVPLYEISSVTSCRFLTRGDADVYRIEAAGRRHYLKVRRPPVTGAQCDAEARFVDHLRENGVPVVRPIRRRNLSAHGVRFVTEVNAPEGPRPILIFEEAPPGKSGPLNDEQSRKLGESLAKLHNAADEWAGTGLGEVDFDLLNNSVQDIIVASNPADEMKVLLHRAAELVQATYARIPRTPPHFGPIHGDLASSNLRIGLDGRFWLFDFGAAQRSWRHNDLLNAKARLLNDAAAPSPQKKWIAFQDGYKSRRTLPPDLSVLEPAYRLSVLIGTLGYISNALTLRLGVEVVDAHDFAKSITEISALVEQCISNIAT
jgi:Ser/Thr protein kinase RdoA (MazF antagonist)